MRDWYLGLDMGTSSVGWAVTDRDYKLLRVRGKDLWGVREFEEAKTAEERRKYRTSRRRNKREKARLGMVRSYFSEAIEKVDPYFFMRLDNSKYYVEDKAAELNGDANGIFNDNNYKDVDYYKQFPTIFHLRKAMLDGNKAVLADPRFVYLAIANMFHHRGHFLLSGVDGEMSGSDLAVNYDSLVHNLEENYSVSFKPDVADKLIEILGSREYGRKRKQEYVTELFSVAKSDKKTIEYIKCICGLSVSANVMFELETEEKYNICFNDYSYTDKIPEITEKVGEDNYQTIELMKQIYDYAVLAGTLKGYEYLSEARIDLYIKHKEDLQLLKRLYRKYKTREEYDEMFRSVNDGTYSAYVHTLNSSDSKEKDAEGKKITKYRRNMKCSTDDLYASVKKAFVMYKDDEEVKYVLEQIEKEQFLPKQLTGANGIIPNQVHKKELAKILSNAEQYLTFLKAVDESGYSVSERIVRLFAFQIPYYIGPVGDKSKTGWAIRKDGGVVLPWNLSEKIDVAATAEEFIHRLIRDCTYLAGEKVMPKSSLEYEKYCVLNEINNLSIDGERIHATLKQQIYDDLFLKGKKVTKEQICHYLAERKLIISKEQVTGVDKTINNYLASYGKMYAVFGDRLKEDKIYSVAERIILAGTIYADSKEMYKAELIKVKEAELIDDAQMKRLMGYKFKDWGRYSQKLLELEGHDPETGEVISIIRALWEYPYNFMELINREEFGFKRNLEEKKENILKTLADFTAEDLDDYYFSAPVKRMIWQTLLVIRELEEVLGCQPQRVFIEMTRSDEEKGEKGRKDSRAKQLLDCYKEIKNTSIHNWQEEIQKADSDGRLRSKKLFLYYCQMGRDAYTGEEIDLSELFDDNKYDIDHIYPRHYVKDDSILNNLVLVNKKDNEHIKKDLYPIPAQISDNPKVKELWFVLRRNNLITEEKYKRLTGKKAFTEEQLAGFIARQLVETGQGTKGVADLLKQLIPNTEIVYSKAGNVSDFRRDNDFYKCRLLNEFHHAKDAYLNIVVGNVYYTKFTQNPKHFIVNEYAHDTKANHYNMAKLFDWDVSRKGYTAWRAGEDGTIQVVRQMMSKNTPLVTRLNYVNTGKLFDANATSKYEAKDDNYRPLNASGYMPVKKYGGYGSIKPAYFVVIEHGNTKKRRICFEAVPEYAASMIKSKDQLKEYCEREKGYTDVKVIASKIKKDSLIKYNGFYLYIAGFDNRGQVEFHNATNMCLNNSAQKYIHIIEKSLQRKVTDIRINSEDNLALYDELTKKHESSIFVSMPKPIHRILLDGRELFMKLDPNIQVDVLSRILTITSLQKGVVSLKEIGGPAENGRIRFSGNMTDSNELKLINYSPAGLKRIVVDLLENGI